MHQLRIPFDIEKRHFCELVTRHKQIQAEGGKSPVKKLKIELARFGFVTGGTTGLKMIVEPDVEVDDDAVLEYLALLKNISQHAK